MNIMRVCVCLSLSLSVSVRALQYGLTRSLAVPHGVTFQDISNGIENADKV